MSNIIEIDEKNLNMSVHPGVYAQEIHEAEEVGLFYPSDSGSMHISQIGRNISESSSGLRGLKFGVKRDYVPELKVQHGRKQPLLIVLISQLILSFQ